jgi:hypothetical protein
LAQSDDLLQSGLRFDLHIRTTTTNSTSGDSTISNVAVRIGTDTIEITNKGKAYMNGVRTSAADFPVPMMGNFSTVQQTMEEISIPSALGNNLQPHSASVFTIEIDQDNLPIIRITVLEETITVRITSGDKQDGIFGEKSAYLGGMLGYPESGTKKNNLRQRAATTISWNTNATEMSYDWQVRETNSSDENNNVTFIPPAMIFGTTQKPQFPDPCIFPDSF